MALTGVVKKYDNAKGFGFIVPTGSRTDLFVRCTDVIGGTLQEGDKVTFDEGLNERTGKPKAFRVAGGSGPAPGGKGDPRDGKQGGKGGKGKTGNKGKGGGFVAGPVPGGCGCSPWGSPAPCGLMLGGGCGLGAGKAAPMPGGCGIKSGVVKFFHDEKGFGFIKQNGGGNDLFVHRSDVIDAPLNEGDHVQYSEVVDKRSGRMKAHQVTGGTGARKPPQKKGAGKGGKGKGGKGSVPTEPSLPNPGMAMMAMGCGCGGSGGCGGGCGGCGQRMGGCSGNCGSLQMSGNSCKAGSSNMPGSCCGLACPPCPTRATPGLRGLPVLLGKKTWAPIERPIAVKIPGQMEKIVEKIPEPCPVPQLMKTVKMPDAASTGKAAKKRLRMERGYWGVE